MKRETQGRRKQKSGVGDPYMKRELGFVGVLGAPTFNRTNPMALRGAQSPSWLGSLHPAALAPEILSRLGEKSLNSVLKVKGPER